MPKRKKDDSNYEKLCKKLKILEEEIHRGRNPRAEVKRRRVHVLSSSSSASSAPSRDSSPAPSQGSSPDHLSQLAGEYQE